MEILDTRVSLIYSQSCYKIKRKKKEEKDKEEKVEVEFVVTTEKFPIGLSKWQSNTWKINKSIDRSISSDFRALTFSLPIMIEYIHNDLEFPSIDQIYTNYSYLL